MTRQKHGGCFDCGRTDGLLHSVTVPPVPRRTSRGVMPPGADSIALCDECLKLERLARGEVSP